MAAAFVIGIDLGTTNTVVAYARIDDTDVPQIQQLATDSLNVPMVL